MLHSRGHKLCTNTQTHIFNVTLPRTCDLPGAVQCSRVLLPGASTSPGLACLRALVTPGASKPGKLLLQYPVELSIGVASLCVPTSLELAFRGVSASNIPFLCLLCHRLLHCRERRDGGERGRVRVLAALVEECGIKARRCLRCSPH